MASFWRLWLIMSNMPAWRLCATEGACAWVCVCMCEVVVVVVGVQKIERKASRFLV